MARQSLRRLRGFLAELQALDEESYLRMGAGSSFWVPFVPSPLNVVRRMLRLADVKPSELVCDLGAGDGVIVTIAASEFGARAVGVERRPDLVERGNARIARAGIEDRAQITCGDLFDFDLSHADIVTMYLYPGVNERLRPKLERELKPSARVVSHDYPVPGWTPCKVEKTSRLGPIDRHTLYLYLPPPPRPRAPDPQHRRLSGGRHP